MERIEIGGKVALHGGNVPPCLRSGRWDLGSAADRLQYVLGETFVLVDEEVIGTCV